MLSEAGLDVAANAFANSVNLIKLHSGPVGASGTANVVIGAQGTPIYTNQGGGVVDVESTLTVQTPAASTVSHFSLWNNSTFLGGNILGSSENYTNAGEANITSAAINITAL